MALMSLVPPPEATHYKFLSRFSEGITAGHAICKRYAKYIDPVIGIDLY